MNYKLLPIVVVCLSGLACLKTGTLPTTPGPVPVVVVADPPLTLANYDKIKVGMTLQEVEAFLGKHNAGGKHEEKAPDGTTRTVIDSASWVKIAIVVPVGGGELKQPEECRIVVELKDGKVASKSQVGLAAEPAKDKDIVGTWHSQDDDKEPLVFEKDGTFKCGFVKEKGEWVMAVGTYTISDDGKIDAKAKQGGTTLGLHYTLKDGVIFGPRGPNPKVEWKKDKG